MMAVLFKKLYDGIVLISLGIILLLNVTGYVGWGIWLFYLNFWPLLLIIAGFRLVLSIKKGLEGIVYLFQILFWLAVIFGGLYYYKTNNEIISTQQVKEFSYAIATDNNFIGKEVSFDFEFSYGEYYLYDTDNTNKDIIKVEGEHTTNINDPQVYTDVRETSTTIYYRQVGNGMFFIPFYNPINNFELTLGSLINNKIKVNLGAGKLTTDFKYSKTNIFEVNIGAGEMITLITDNAEISLIDAKIGAGKMVISLPLNYGYIISYNVGAGSLKLEDKEMGGLATVGSDVKSSNIEIARKIITINVSVGAGEFDLQYASK